MTFGDHHTNEHSKIGLLSRCNLPFIVRITVKIAFQYMLEQDIVSLQFRLKEHVLG